MSYTKKDTVTQVVQKRPHTHPRYMHICIKGLIRQPLYQSKYAFVGFICTGLAFIKLILSRIVAWMFALMGLIYIISCHIVIYVCINIISRNIIHIIIVHKTPFILGMLSVLYFLYCIPYMIQKYMKMGDAFICIYGCTGCLLLVIGITKWL